MLAVISITFLCVADVKCGLYDINKNKRANATDGPSPVQKMFRDRTEVILDWRSPGPGPGPVLTLLCTYQFHSTVSTNMTMCNSKTAKPAAAWP